MRSALVISLPILLLSGCSANAVQVRMLNPQLARTAGSYVKVYNNSQSLDRPVKDVAAFEAHHPRGSYSEMITEMRQEASRLGADALVLEEFTSTGGAFDTLKGTAVVYVGSEPKPIARVLPKHACATSDELCRYERACKAGQGLSCVGLGVALMEGDVIARDVARAADLFEDACVQGYGVGCAHFGLANFQGVGRPQNDTAAIRTFKKACDLGEMAGCRYLGVLYLGSPNVEATAGYAEVSLNRACLGRDGWSCWRLGKMYAEGEHVAPDGNKAGELYQRACKLGIEFACGAAPVTPNEMASNRLGDDVPALAAPRH